MKTQPLSAIVSDQLQSGPDFRRGYLAETVNLFFTQELDVAKSMLIHYINATIGFPALARHLNRTSASLTRILGPTANPRAGDLFDLVAALCALEGCRLETQSFEVNRKKTKARRGQPEAQKRHTELGSQPGPVQQQSASVRKAA